MASPTRYQLARANNNEEIAYIISGANSYDPTGPLTISGGVTTEGARSAGITGNDMTNYGYVGAVITTNVTVISGSPIIQVEVQGKDSTSGTYYNILSGAIIDVVSGSVLKIHPDLTGVTNVTAKDVIPRKWRINVANIGGTDAITYTVGVAPIVR